MRHPGLGALRGVLLLAGEVGDEPVEDGSLLLREAALAAVLKDCWGKLVDVDAACVESLHLLDIQVQHLHTARGDALDFLLFVDEDEGNVRAHDLLVDFEECNELDPQLGALDHLELEPDWEEVARFVPGKDKSLLVRNILSALSESVVQDPRMVLGVQLRHHFLDIVILDLVEGVPQDAAGSRVALGYGPYFVWVSRDINAGSTIRAHRGDVVHIIMKVVGIKIILLDVSCILGP